MKRTLRIRKGFIAPCLCNYLICKALIFLACISSRRGHLNHKTMITERIALVMLDGEVPASKDDPAHTKQYYKSIQAFADASFKLCEEGKFKKLERFLKVAFKLFKEGNATVKNGIVNVYLFSLSRSMDKDPAARRWIEPFMPKDLRLEYAKIQYASGM